MKKNRQKTLERKRAKKRKKRVAGKCKSTSLLFCYEELGNSGRFRPINPVRK
jgi:hypothetical protein